MNNQTGEQKSIKPLAAQDRDVAQNPLRDVAQVATSVKLCVCVCVCTPPQIKYLMYLMCVLLLRSST